MIRYDHLPHGFMIGDRFMVEGLLGKGRSSAVYRALDTRTATTVSLKVLDPFLACDPVNLQRFTRELEVLRSLRHDNIIKLYSCFQSGEFYVLVMEYFAGLDGISWLDRYGVMGISDFLTIAGQVVSAIRSCHQARILHRDLKPHNILISDDRECKVVDFGISLINTMSDLTKTGTILGSPEYMAPERFTTGRADPRSDIYALGAVFYELLTGRPPYCGGSLPAVMARQMAEDIAGIPVFRQDVPRWLEKIIYRCLKADPNKRYQSCGELLHDLERGERTPDADAVTVECFGCKAELIPGLPFCHNCGKFSAEIMAAGPCAIVLHRCGAPAALIDYLHKAFPATATTDLTRRLARLPTPLFTNISREMAHSIVHELSSLPLDLGIIENLPKAFQLPRYYFLLGLLPVSLVVVGLPLSSNIYLPAALSAMILGEGLVYALYRHQSRPVIALGRSGRAAVGDQLEEVARLAAQFRDLSQPGMKYLMGIVVAQFLRRSDKGLTDALTLDPQLLGRLVQAGFDTAKRVEKLVNFLDGTSLNAIKATLDRLDLQMTHADGTAAVAALAAEQAKWQAEFARYVEIQDSHAQLTMSLLNLRVLFSKLDDRLEMPLQELQAVAQGLGVCQT